MLLRLWVHLPVVKFKSLKSVSGKKCVFFKKICFFENMWTFVGRSSSRQQGDFDKTIVFHEGFRGVRGLVSTGISVNWKTEKHYFLDFWGYSSSRQQGDFAKTIKMNLLFWSYLWGVRALASMGISKKHDSKIFSFSFETHEKTQCFEILYEGNMHFNWFLFPK